jgi:hypothetical protein
MEWVLVAVIATVLGTLVLGIRMRGRLRQFKRRLILVGSSYWLVLWTAFYVMFEAMEPRPHLGLDIFVLMFVPAIHIVILMVLLLAKLQWAALGYFAGMALNVAGQFLVYNVLLDAEQVLVGGMTYSTRHIGDFSSLLVYLSASIPFFLPVNYNL